MSFPSCRLLAAAAAALLLCGCSSKVVICPVPAILADAATLTVFRAGTVPDLANELYSVSLTNAESNCTYTASTGDVTSALNLTFRATRAPTTEGATYYVKYFVVVNENAKLYSKRILTLPFTFAPGATSVTTKQSPDDIIIHIGNGKLPWNYQLLSGLQVTQGQIDYNKKMGRYVP
jgi:hypothetical protein